MQEMHDTNKLGLTLSQIQMCAQMCSEKYSKYIWNNIRVST